MFVDAAMMLNFAGSPAHFAGLPVQSYRFDRDSAQFALPPAHLSYLPLFLTSLPHLSSSLLFLDSLSLSPLSLNSLFHFSLSPLSLLLFLTFLSHFSLSPLSLTSLTLSFLHHCSLSCLSSLISYCLVHHASPWFTCLIAFSTDSLKAVPPCSLIVPSFSVKVLFPRTELGKDKDLTIWLKILRRCSHLSTAYPIDDK